jgi:hypothetical protein
MCDKPTDQTKRILDFYKVAAYIAAHEGYSWDSNDLRNWPRKVLSQMEYPGNDCYISWGKLDDEDEDEYGTELWQFGKGLEKYFDIGDEDILLNISW